MGKIGENIKQARVSRNLTQGKVAELIGEKRTSYVAWEGDTEPNGSVLYKLAKILEVSIFDLLGEPDPNISSKQPDLSPEQFPRLLYGELRELVKATQLIAENTKRVPAAKEGIDLMNEKLKKDSVSDKGKKSKPEA